MAPTAEAQLIAAAAENTCAECPASVVQLTPELEMAVCTSCDACVTLLDPEQYRDAVSPSQEQTR